MPQFTFTFSTNEITALQKITTTHNANTGQALTVQQWLDLHHKELAITEDLTAAVRVLHEQQQQDAQATLEAAINTARDQLLAQL